MWKNLCAVDKLECETKKKKKKFQLFDPVDDAHEDIRYNALHVNIEIPNGISIQLFNLNMKIFL